MHEPSVLFARSYELGCGERGSHCVACEQSPDALRAPGTCDPMEHSPVGNLRAAIPAERRCPRTASGDHYIASYARRAAEVHHA